MTLIKTILAKFYKRKSLVDPTQNYSELPLDLAGKHKSKTLVNIGAGQERLGEHVITLDLYELADIHADAINLPIKSNSVDGAFSIAVLEHLKEPKQAVNELWRIIKPGGFVYIEIPFLQPFHSSPHDYYRATLPGLQHWCRDFQEIESGVCVGPGSTISWILIEYVRVWFGPIPVLGLVSELTTRALLLPFKYLDKFLINRPESAITASAIYFYGLKPKP